MARPRVGLMSRVRKTEAVGFGSSESAAVLKGSVFAVVEDKLKVHRVHRQ
jgi:hypothetical protein